MKLCYIIDGDWYLRSQNAMVPFEVLRNEWKNQVGNYTADGDLVLSVEDMDVRKFKVIIEAKSESTLRKFGGVQMPLSYEITTK